MPADAQRPRFAQKRTAQAFSHFLPGSFRLPAQAALVTLGAPGVDGLPGADGDTEEQHCRGGCGRGRGHPIPANEFVEAINRARRAGQDRFLIQIPFEVPRQAVGRFVAAVPVLLQTLHHDPIEVPVNCGLRIADCGFGRV